MELASSSHCPNWCVKSAMHVLQARRLFRNARAVRMLYALRARWENMAWVETPCALGVTEAPRGAAQEAQVNRTAYCVMLALFLQQILTA